MKRKTIAFALLAFLALALCESHKAHAADPTTSFVLTAAKQYITENYSRSASIINSSPAAVVNEGEANWYIKALFDVGGIKYFGEFWVGARGKSPSDLYVVRANVRRH